MGSVNIINGGLDVQGIVDNLIYVEREPIRKLEEQAKTCQDRVAAYQTFNSKLLALKTSVESLLFSGETVPLNIPTGFNDRLSTSVFALRTASSSDEAVLTATAGKGVTTGTFSVNVLGLARSNSYASNNFASDTATAAKTGTLIIQKGTDDPVTITIDSTNNTLQGIKNAINAANAGFSANILNDGSGTPYRLMITSNESGTANALTITNNLTAGDGQDLTVAETVAAADAALQINGVDVTSSSNTVTGAIEGVTLNLRAEAGSAAVTVERDIDSIVAAVKDFAEKYSDVVSFISSQFRYDATKKQAGLLSGDFTLRQVQSGLSSTLAQSIDSDGSPLTVLSQVGIRLASDGTLSVDEAKLKDALSADFSAVAHILIANAVNDGGNAISIIPQLQSRLRNVTDSIDGSVFHAQDAVQKNIDRINRQIAQMEERLEMRRQLLIDQFARADQALRQLNVLQSSLNGQIDSLKSFKQPSE